MIPHNVRNRNIYNGTLKSIYLKEYTYEYDFPEFMLSWKEYECEEIKRVKIKKFSDIDLEENKIILLN